MKIDIDAVNQRVKVSLFGVFAERQAQYVEGRGCVNVFKDTIIDRPVPPPPSTKPDALWPDGEKPQLSDNARLRAAISDPALLGPGCALLSTLVFDATPQTGARFEYRLPADILFFRIICYTRPHARAL